MEDRHRLAGVVVMVAALEARSLYRFFHTGDEEVFALRNASLHVERGEVVAIVGPSGSGKSTLLNCIAGLDEPDGGSVFVDGQQITRRSEMDRAKVRASSLGILFQSHNLIGHLTVGQNITVARHLAGHRGRRGRDEAGADPGHVLEMLGLATRVDARVDQLSGGEAARAGMAVATANNPAVLLADEPTGEVDGPAETRVITLLRQQAYDGRAVVVVTHSPSVADMADRVLTLSDGCLS